MKWGELKSFQRVGAGAIWGLLASLAYAASERLFLTIWQELTTAGVNFAPLDWFQTAQWFAVYAGLGLGTGALWGLTLSLAAHKLGALREMDACQLARVASALTLIWALAVNMAFLAQSRMEVVTRLAVSIAWSGALIASFRRHPKARSGWLLIWESPWTASLLLLGVPLMNRYLLPRSGGLRQAAAALSLLFLLAAAGSFWSRIKRRQKQGRHEVSAPWPPAGALAGNLAGIAIALALSFFIAHPPSLRPVRSGDARPNIILVTMDTVRADHLSVYGYDRDTTPHLEQFARQATLYRLAVATSDMTLSSHASLFTGLYSRRHGAHQSEPGRHAEGPYGTALQDKFPTLAQILSGRGYVTIGVAANSMYLGPDFHLSRGFQFYSVVHSARRSTKTDEFFLREGLGKIREAWFSPEKRMLYRRAEHINREALRLLQRRAQGGEPFFLFLNYMDAHQPYLPPAPFDTRFPGKDKDLTPSQYYEAAVRVNSGSGKLSDTERKHALSQYDGGLAYIDFELDQLLSRLDSLGVLENALIIVTADHGETFGEHDLVLHGGIGVYEGLVHIPMFVRYPHQREAKTVGEPVSLVDVLPTVMDAVGLPTPLGLDGQSLLRPLPSDRFVISESFPGQAIERLHPRFRRVDRALYAGHWKLISSTASKREFYDLAKDPAETTDLYRPDEARSRAYEKKLEDWLRTVPAESPRSFKLSRESVESLKSLGYVQ